MAHNKDRTRVSMIDVNWEDPRVKGLLEKTQGLSIEQRSGEPGTGVSLRIADGWDATVADKPALLVDHDGDSVVVITHFPLPHGGDVRITGLPTAGSVPRWAVVTDERKGNRAEDEGRDIYLHRLRLR